MIVLFINNSHSLTVIIFNHFHWINQLNGIWIDLMKWCDFIYMPWLQSFTASFLRVNEESELISSHFVHFFNSSLNFIQFHSMNWLKWEWMKPFTQHSDSLISINFNHSPAGMNEIWWNSMRAWHAVRFIHSISLTSFQFS